MVLVLNGMGILSALVVLAVVVRLVHRQLMPGSVCVAGAVVGICASAAYLFAAEGSTGFRTDSLAAKVWVDWVAFAPVLLPLEAGLLGWLGTASKWRWFFLGAGLLLIPLLYLAALIIR